ncbi:MAG: hypothetical protein LDL41_21410, partial [Coleofasciculus sp. S288]|nr:hypothetical protein [Coleofasciculus sp. S288]
MSTNQKSELLQRLVIEAQQHLTETRERQFALTKLVDEILRSRRICRPLKGQFLSNVLPEIYQEVQQQLLRLVEQSIDNCNPQNSLRNWATFLLHRAFQHVLDDKRLKQLALEAQQHPSTSQERQYILTELINAIQLSGKLHCPPQSALPHEVYQLIYDDAVNRTLLYVFQKIDYYDPQRGRGRFMNWVNFRLKMIFIELVNQTFKLSPILCEEMEKQSPEEESPSLSEILSQCI